MSTAEIVLEAEIVLGAEEEACSLTALDLSRRSCLGLLLSGIVPAWERFGLL